MIDIHSHILYGVDDGIQNIDDSILLLKQISMLGIKDIILTPHYIEYSAYSSDLFNNLTRVEKINSKLKENNIDINIHLGNEIHITENILDLLNKKQITTLCNSNYLLIELPMSGLYDNYMDIFLDLIEKGYKVILAHPERYIYHQNNFDELIDIHKKGILFQCNFESILGKYGGKAKKTLKKLIKNNLVDFIGSDIHSNKEYRIVKGMKKIEKINKNQFTKLMNQNINIFKKTL